MKRLFAVFTLCATTLIAASAVSGPAAADGRHDARRHAGQSDRETSRFFAERGTQRRAFLDHRDRRARKFQRGHERHRHAHRNARGYSHRHAFGYSHRHGYAYGPPRYRHGTRMGSAYALRLDGARFIFRFD